MLRCNIDGMSDNRIAAIALDEATILARGADVEREREAALRDLGEDSAFVPLRAVEQGHRGPWSLDLSVPDGRLCIGLTDGKRQDAGTIVLGLARFRRVVREYFAICDSYYKALRQASASELETLDMARRAIHDRATRGRSSSASRGFVGWCANTSRSAIRTTRRCARPRPASSRRSTWPAGRSTTAPRASCSARS
jgi:uncharacterized protein (UPF0262 family)